MPTHLTDVPEIFKFLPLYILQFVVSVQQSLDIKSKSKVYVTYENVKGQKPNWKSLVLFRIHEICQSQPCLSVMVVISMYMIWFNLEFRTRHKLY